MAKLAEDDPGWTSDSPPMTKADIDIWLKRNPNIKPIKGKPGQYAKVKKKKKKSVGLAILDAYKASK